MSHSQTENLAIRYDAAYIELSQKIEQIVTAITSCRIPTGCYCYQNNGKLSEDEVSSTLCRTGYYFSTADKCLTLFRKEKPSIQEIEKTIDQLLEILSDQQERYEIVSNELGEKTQALIKFVDNRLSDILGGE